jgi:hypothetical protein
MPCGWLERAQHNQQVIVWLRGTQPSPRTPVNKGGVHLVSGDDLEFLKHENGLDIYKHKVSGVIHVIRQVQAGARPCSRHITEL